MRVCASFRVYAVRKCSPRLRPVVIQVELCRVQLMFKRRGEVMENTLGTQRDTGRPHQCNIQLGGLDTGEQLAPMDRPLRAAWRS